MSTRTKIYWTIGGIFLLIAMWGAKPKPTVHGICLYEVSVSMVINTVTIGWTPPPCQEIDIRIEEHFYALNHSAFQPLCPIFSVQTWPDTPLPVVDYDKSCNVTLPLKDRRAGVMHAIIERGGSDDR